MAQGNHDFSLVLIGRFAGKDRSVAQAISKCFGRDDAWGLQVVGAAPITILTGLNAAQAQSVYAQMVEIENLGCRFEIQPGVDNSNPKVGWPGPVRVNGKLLAEFGGSGTHRAAGRQADIALACPHCGQTVHVQVTAALHAHGPTPGLLSGGAPPIPVPKAAPAAAPPVAPGAPVPVPFAPMHAARSAPAVRQGTRLGPAAQLPGGAAPIQVDGMEELSPLPEGAKPLTPRQVRRPTGGVPLPEVPVVDAGVPMPPPHPRPTPSGMDPRMSGPMGLDEFEKGLQMSAPPPIEAHPPALEPVTQQAGGTTRSDAGGAPRAALEDNSDAVCSIFIGKSTNPKVHALVAEIQGTTTEEAQRLCLKPVVPIVKDIPLSEAGAIKDRFLEINITPRVMIKR